MALLVIGATGTLGRQIVRQALNEGFVVRCLVRNIRKASFLKDWGAELVYGDLNSPSTLPPCFKGITSVIDASTGRPTDNLNVKDVDWNGKIAMLKVAKTANIKRIIFFSILNSDKYKYIPLMNLKSKFEFILQNSGIPYTIFQVSGFFQGLIGQYALPVLEQLPIYVTKESLPVSYIDTADIAKFCLRSLRIKETENAVFKLGGSRALMSEDLIKKCELLSGQKAKINQLPRLLVKLSWSITNFFQWSWNVSDRLAFIDVFSGKENFSVDYEKLKSTFRIEPRELLSVDKYFEQYFKQILSKLKDLDYNDAQMTKRKDIVI